LLTSRQWQPRACWQMRDDRRSARR
jgi:hypothetical protein